MIVGLAGAINELFDRLMLRRLLPFTDLENLKQLGIYGYSYKIAMIMTLFLQAFKYAIEPFYFSESEKKDAPETYARVTKYFVIAGLFIFLIVALNLDVVASIFDKMNFDSAYQKGLIVVPILLLANLFLGIYFNVSTWYKVTDKTQYGALIAVVGALLTIGLNFWWIPTIGFLGSAIATLICYVVMVIMAFYFGRKFYPIPYDLGALSIYFATALMLYFVFSIVMVNIEPSLAIIWAIKINLLIVFCLVVFFTEKRINVGV
jgi:O-antigen/teichoic acid export membrane protein